MASSISRPTPPPLGPWPRSWACSSPCLACWCSWWRALLPFLALESRSSGCESLAVEESLTTRRPRYELAETLQPVRDRAVAFAAAWPVRYTHHADHPDGTHVWQTLYLSGFFCL